MFYLTGQNIISALGIYIANDILSRYTGGNWLATVVTIITTGAVIYVAPFGPRSPALWARSAGSSSPGS